MKAYDLFPSDFEFETLDVSWEFNEYIEFVFIRKRTIFFVFKKGNHKTKNQESFIKEYYKGYDFKHIKFLKQE